jgi:hypothetical protein
MAHDLLVQALVGPPRQYWEALGRFVSVFSLVEENMQVALWRCVGVKAPVAPAIFSGTRVDAASGYIKRIAEAQHWPRRKQQEIEDVFKQLAELTRVRNDILHYGASMTGPDEWVVSNKLVAHVKERIRNTRISVKILVQMSEDLSKIMLHLVMIERRGKPVRAHPSVEAVLKRAWLYKPDRQSGSQAGDNPRQPQTPKRPRRRGPSRALSRSR